MSGQIILAAQIAAAVQAPSTGFVTLFIDIGTGQPTIRAAGGGLTAFLSGPDPDGSLVTGALGAKVGVLATDAQHGNRGGASLHALVVSGGASGFISGADKAQLDSLVASAVLNTRSVIAGAGLIGGGALAADRTFNVVANADGSIVVNADDIQVGVISDAQHGPRGGGTQHAAVIAGGLAGFISGADKAKLDATPLAYTVQRLNANANTTVITATATTLSFPIAANEVWEVQCDITAQCSGVGGMKYAIGAPAGASVEGWLQSSLATLTTLSFQRFTAVNTLTTTAVHTVAATPAPDTVTFTIVNGPTPGVVTLQIAAGVAGQTATALAGSSLRAVRAVNV